MAMIGAADQAGSWSDALKNIFTYGAGAYIDSQLATPYQINDPRYNTAGGTGGQPQTTPQAVESKSNIALIAAGVVALLAVVYLIRK